MTPGIDDMVSDKVASLSEFVVKTAVSYTNNLPYELRHPITLLIISNEEIMNEIDDQISKKLYAGETIDWLLESVTRNFANGLEIEFPKLLHRLFPTIHDERKIQKVIAELDALRAKYDAKVKEDVSKLIEKFRVKNNKLETMMTQSPSKLINIVV
jgi:hypothetical protein